MSEEKCKHENLTTVQGFSLMCKDCNDAIGSFTCEELQEALIMLYEIKKKKGKVFDKN